MRSSKQKIIALSMGYPPSASTQMAIEEPRTKRALPTRVATFEFSTLGTLRDLNLRRARSMSRPAGRLTLTITAVGTAKLGTCKLPDTIEYHPVRPRHSTRHLKRIR